MYRDQTVPTLAAWLKITIKTAKNRLCGAREFTLGDVEKLLHSDQGFEILSALMTRAKRKPHWWLVCEPLMEFASRCKSSSVSASRKRCRKQPMPMMPSHKNSGVPRPWLFMIRNFISRVSMRFAPSLARTVAWWRPKPDKRRRPF